MLNFPSGQRPTKSVPQPRKWDTPTTRRCCHPNWRVCAVFKVLRRLCHIELEAVEPFSLERRVSSHPFEMSMSLNVLNRFTSLCPWP